MVKCVVSSLHHLQEWLCIREEPTCISPLPGPISGLKSTSHQGSLWIPEAFPVHISVASAQSSPVLQSLCSDFLLGVPASGQLCTGLLGLSRAGSPGPASEMHHPNPGKQAPGRGWFYLALEPFLPDGFPCGGVRQTSGICAI